MRDLRLPFEQLDYVLLQYVVGVRHPLMLAKMLGPRGHEERFQKPARLRCILEYPPRPGAVSQAFVLDLVES